MIKTKYTSAITDTPWWLAGGIPRDACVAAYQPVGASDYASSKVNIANPGTYNAVDGTAYPTWSPLGWNFVSESLQYINSTIPANKILSLIVGYTGLSNDSYMGSRDPSNKSYLGFRFRGSASRTYYLDFSLSTANYIGSINPNGSHVLALVLNDGGYADGVWLLSTGEMGTTNAVQFYIGALNNGADAAESFSTINVKSIAFYSTMCTNIQIAALTAAMNAL